jgi:hypothetical protein
MGKYDMAAFLLARRACEAMPFDQCRGVVRLQAGVAEDTSVFQLRMPACKAPGGAGGGGAGGDTTGAQGVGVACAARTDWSGHYSDVGLEYVMPTAERQLEKPISWAAPPAVPYLFELAA